VLGLQVVIEDYIHTKATKLILLLFIQFAGVGLVATGVVSLLLIAIYGG